MSAGGFTFGLSQFPHTAVSVVPPATVTGANNGLSLNGTNVVLGGDVGAGSDLLNNREIYTNGNLLTFLFDNGGASDRLDINEFELLWTAAGGTPRTEILAGQMGMFGDDNTIQFVGTSAQNSFILQNSIEQLQIIGQAGFAFPHWRFLNDNVRRGDFLFEGGLESADPGTGAGVWKFGTTHAAAVALDAANYVEVSINGVIVKLGIVV